MASKHIWRINQLLLQLNSARLLIFSNVIRMIVLIVHLCTCKRRNKQLFRIDFINDDDEISSLHAVGYIIN